MCGDGTDRNRVVRHDPGDAGEPRYRQRVKLSYHPDTDRLARRFDRDDGLPWLVIAADGTTTWVSDEDIAGEGWRAAVLAPKPPDPVFAFSLACGTCAAHPMITSVTDRERLAAVHAGMDCAWDSSKYAIKIQHPNRAPDDRVPQYRLGDTVTFWGSTGGEVAHFVDATIHDRDEQHVTANGDVVSGYEIAINQRVMFAPATALETKRS